MQKLLFSWPFLPSLRRRLFRDFRPSFWRHALGTRRTTLFAERFCGWVLAVIRYGVFDLAGQYAHDVDGIADHVGRAFFAFRAAWHGSLTSRSFGDAQKSMPRCHRR